MWDMGTLDIEGTKVQYWVKHYDEPSEEYGIDGGRISKLSLKINGRYTLNYDREWDIRPKNEASRKAYEILVKKFN